MKKSPLLIPIILMFVILAVLLVYMALPLGKAAVEATGGVMDLRGHDLSAAVYQLSGEWQKTPRQLVAPDEFPDDAPLRSIPEGWASTYDELNTFATYRLRIYTDDTRLLTMFIPEIYMSYDLWVNGEYIRGAGVVATNPADAVPEFESAIVPVRAQDGVIEIVIQGSNFHYLRSVMSSVILLGENDSAHAWFFRTRAIYMIALGLFIAGSFYHIALYVLRRKEIIYLLFALLSLVCFWRYAIDTNGLSNLAGWFYELGGLADIKTFMTLLFLHGTAIAAFSLYVFDREWMAKHRLWVLAYTALGAALFATIPWNTHHGPLIVITAMAPVALFTIYKGARSRQLRVNKMMWLYFIAFVIYAITSVVQKYFFDHVLFMTGIVGDLFLLMSQALILSSQYTETVTREQALALDNVALDRVNRLKNDLVAVISHELRTPLTVMSNYSQLAVKAIERGDYAHESLERLKIIPREAKRLADLSEILLRTFKEQDGARSKTLLSMSELITHTADVFKPIMDKKQNTQKLQVAPDLPPVNGNADELMQVMFNILSNADTHTKDGEIIIKGELTIDAGTTVGAPLDAPATQFVTVSVADTGKGIEPELLPHVLEKRRHGESGTGYGLSICKEIIEDHGGSIEIKSTPTTGTTVTFTIPAWVPSNNQ